MDHRSLRFPDQTPKGPTPFRDRLPSALRDPLRATGIAAFAVLAVGALLPWIRAWLPGRGTFEISGFERSGDAGLVLELAAVAAVLIWSDRAWGSRLGAAVAGPVVLGGACVLVLRIAHSEASDFLVTLIPAGGYGEILPAFWLTAAGAAVLTIVGGIHAWRARSRVSYNPGITAPAIAGTIGAIVGAIVGFIAGTKIAELLTAGAIAGVSTSVLVILAFALAFAGAWVGGAGAASLARSRES